MDAELRAIDKRIGKARRVRDQEREPLAKVLRRALAPHYGEAARLLREAEERLQAARGILATAEDFAGRNGVSLTAFTSRLPAGLEPVVHELEARS
jgi:hypothetical protein